MEEADKTTWNIIQLLGYTFRRQKEVDVSPQGKTSKNNPAEKQQLNDAWC